MGAAAILVLIYWPALRWMVNSWVSSDYYSHGFLVPVVTGFFIWIKRDQLKKREPSLFGMAWLILSAGLYVWGFLSGVRFMGILSLLGVITGLVLAICGKRTVRALVFPLVFLLFMVPFPFIQDVAYNLQYISVHWAAWITEVMQLPIKTAGTEIYLGNNITFTVGVVCSGINTLVALLALSAVYAYILQGSKIKRLGLWAMAFPIAIGANILRIVSIIVVAYYSNLEIATGWYHDLSSPLFFLIAFMLLVMIGWLMKFKINFDVAEK